MVSFVQLSKIQIIEFKKLHFFDFFDMTLIIRGILSLKFTAVLGFFFHF